MLQSETSKRFIRQFTDLYDIAQFLETPAVWPSVKHSVTNKATDQWDLNAGYEGTIRAMRDGWPEGLEAIGADVASIPNATLYEKEYGFAGEFPDVPRYLSGDPRNMVHRGKQHKPTSVMTLAVNISCSGATRASAMRLYGAAMAAIVDRLEARHTRVELIAYWVGSDKGMEFAYSWTVKRAEDPLDLNAIVFSLGHPGSLRRMGFAIHERSLRKLECSSYGYPRDIATREDFVDLAPDALIIGGIGMNGGDSKCRTMAEALSFVEGQVNMAAGEPIASLEAL